MSDEQTQGEVGVGFLVLAFTDETSGDSALDAMKDAMSQGQFYFEDAAVIRQDIDGKVHYHETGDMTMGKGAAVGALVGGVIGILGGPAGIAIGAATGAAIGAAAAHGDAGFKNESLQTIGVALKPGTSAVAAVTDDAFLEAVQMEVSAENIRTMVSNLAAEISANLAVGKSVALGLVLTESGLAIEEVAADEKSATVVGLAITDDAVVVGGAVVTADEADVIVAGAAADDQGDVVAEVDAAAADAEGDVVAGSEVAAGTTGDNG
jgi:uncharacterized membrane protein